jgi:putative deaminase/isomerase
MKITILDTHEEVSRTASALILRQLETDPNLLLCAATGNTPSRTYALLAKECDRRPERFTNLRVLKLDEWGGLAPADPGSCEYYLRTRLLDPLRITGPRYAGFDSRPKDPVAECARIQSELSASGPIDCCVLGLGVNGHIGFNEPAAFLDPACHVARLAPTTMQHNMVDAMQTRPSYGLTLGIADILQARMILLLISGDSKKEITRELLTRRVTPELPASFLWLHGNVRCLIDKAAAGDHGTF